LSRVNPTDSEGALSQFIQAIAVVRRTGEAGGESLKAAPVHAPRRRLDETPAARKPALAYKGPGVAAAAE
jgi:glycine dehydrogenase subunit 2